MKKEKILNLLLLGSISLGILAQFINSLAYINSIINNTKHLGDNPIIVAIFNLVLILLLIKSKKGYSKVVSVIFVSILTLGAFYTLYLWGADVPQGLLILSIVIVISGILLGGKIAIILTLVISIYLIFLTYLQSNSFIQIESHWKNNILEVKDSVMTSISLFIITIVSWLSNREMERSLERAEASERALKKERDMLEQRVAERTAEVQQMQVEKITQLYRFADFGRLASGLMHDLVNPLTSVSLNIDHMATHKKTFKAAIKRAQTGIKRMESYVEAARKQVQQQETHKTFSVKQELTHVINIFSYRQKKEHVVIKLDMKKDVKTFGNPIAFNQAVSNILANAFDAYDGFPTSNKNTRQIVVESYVEKNTIHISIQDWGRGIDKNTLPHIFEPFFTTKNADKGTGIGLSISKKSIEEKLHGTVAVKSSKTKGTLFTISLPIIKKS